MCLFIWIWQALINFSDLNLWKIYQCLFIPNHNQNQTSSKVFIGPVLTSKYIFRSQAKNKAPMNFWSSKWKQNQKVKKLSQIPSSESTDFSILLHPWVCKCHQNKNKYLNVLLLVTLPKFVIIQLRQRET